VRFDGSNDYLKSNGSVTYGANIVTVCAWVKAATWPGGAGTYQVWESGATGPGTAAANVFNAYSDFSTFQVALNGDAFSQRFENVSPDPADATWVHIAVVYDNSTATGDAKVYYDGVLQGESAGGSKTGTANFGAEILNIASRNGASRFAAIDVDDFRIYSGELNSTEVAYVRDNPDE
jgi:hypothetical protein